MQCTEDHVLSYLRFQLLIHIFKIFAKQCSPNDEKLGYEYSLMQFLKWLPVYTLSN